MGKRRIKVYLLASTGSWLETVRRSYSLHGINPFLDLFFGLDSLCRCLCLQACRKSGKVPPCKPSSRKHHGGTLFLDDSNFIIVLWHIYVHKFQPCVCCQRRIWVLPVWANTSNPKHGWMNIPTKTSLVMIGQLWKTLRGYWPIAYEHTKAETFATWGPNRHTKSIKIA